MAFQPMPMSRKSLPFDHPDWIFELKYNRFRSLPVLQNGRKRQTKLMFGCDARKGPEWTALTSGMGHFQCPDESR